MKLKALALALLLPACAAAAEDCAKNADACSAGRKTLSPFLAASAAEPEAAKPAPPLRKASLRQAPVSTAPAAGEIPAAPAPAAAPGPQASSPAWVLLVIAGLAGLYYYLGGGRRRGRRK
ncbi:MAG: hypothetical protein ACYC2I_00945 [Elusimicrobiales bacterium]